MKKHFFGWHHKNLQNTITFFYMASFAIYSLYLLIFLPDFSGFTVSMPLFYIIGITLIYGVLYLLLKLADMISYMLRLKRIFPSDEESWSRYRSYILLLSLIITAISLSYFSMEISWICILFLVSLFQIVDLSSEKKGLVHILDVTMIRRLFKPGSIILSILILVLILINFIASGTGTLDLARMFLGFAIIFVILLLLFIVYIRKNDDSEQWFFDFSHTGVYKWNFTHQFTMLIFLSLALYFLLGFLGHVLSLGQRIGIALMLFYLSMAYLTLHHEIHYYKTSHRLHKMIKPDLKNPK